MKKPKIGRPQKFREDCKKLVLRVPASLHARAQDRACVKKQSLNDYILAAVGKELKIPMEDVIETKQEGVKMTIMARNLLKVVELVDEHKWAALPTLVRHIQLELGVTEKKAIQYVDLLAFHNKLISQNGYIVSMSYKGIMPWKDEFQKALLSKQDTKETPHEYLKEAEEVLERATAPQEHKHEGEIGHCQNCGKEVCLKCAGSFFSSNGSIIARCRECG